MDRLGETGGLCANERRAGRLGRDPIGLTRCVRCSTFSRLAGGAPKECRATLPATTPEPKAGGPYREQCGAATHRTRACEPGPCVEIEKHWSCRGWMCSGKPDLWVCLGCELWRLELSMMDLTARVLFPSRMLSNLSHEGPHHGWPLDVPKADGLTYAAFHYLFDRHCLWAAASPASSAHLRDRAVPALVSPAWRAASASGRDPQHRNPNKQVCASRPVCMQAWISLYPEVSSTTSAWVSVSIWAGSTNFRLLSAKFWCRSKARWVRRVSRAEVGQT